MSTLFDFHEGDEVEYNPQDPMWTRYSGTKGVVLGVDGHYVRVSWDRTSSLYLSQASMRTLGGARMCPGWIKLTGGGISNIPEPLDGDLI